MKVNHDESDTFILTKKLSRIQLSKLTNFQLEKKLAELTDKVAEANSQLVELLIQKDALHMERDSILVDIEDLNGISNEDKTLFIKFVERILHKSN